MIVVLFRQADARIIGQTGRAVGNDIDRRNQKRGLTIELWVALTFVEPDASRLRRMSQRVGILGPLKKLIAGAPSAIAALDDIYPARRVAPVRIVVSRKKVS